MNEQRTRRNLVQLGDLPARDLIGLITSAVKREISNWRAKCKEAIDAGDTDQARRLLAAIEKISGLREHVERLESQWLDALAYISGKRRSRRLRGVKRRRNLGRLPRGAALSEKEFRLPILKALADMGGQAPARHVTQAVFQRMKHVLKEADLRPMTSQPSTKRWENTAGWCRHALVKEGLLRRDSPRGMWAISEKGKQALVRMSGGTV